jgi:hypothetical protein
VSKSKRELIWIPQLTFTNSLNSDFIENGGISSLTIQQIGDYFLNPVGEIHEERLFHGMENPLIYRKTYEMHLHCNYVLYNYPFDVQWCKIMVIILFIIITKSLLLEKHKEYYLIIVERVKKYKVN